jgi:hypothetical protein
MKTLTAVISLLAVLAPGPGLLAQTGPDEALFREAKLLVYDKDWEAALVKIEELRGQYPGSVWSAQALFYKGECLNGLGGREREALRAYKDYVRSTEARANLVEEAEGRVVDLALDLYEKGDAAAVREVETRLEHKNTVVRYYAAYKLSLVKDKRTAAKAAPVLRTIIETEKDEELLDRARIALLRVSPEGLKEVEDRKSSPGAPRKIKIRIYEKGQKEAAFSLNIPWSLADLALSAIDEETKAELRKQGKDLDRILRDLTTSKEKLVRIVGADGSVVEIWID